MFPCLLLLVLGQQPNLNLIDDPSVISVDGISPTGPELDYELCIKYLQDHVSADLRPTTRFLSLHALCPDKRHQGAIVTSMVLNSLSWNSRITPPVYVPNTQDRILAFNVLNYCRSDINRRQQDAERWIKSWELLTYTDPYYLVPWVDSEQAVLLYELTGSAGAVLRADFFCFYTTLEDNQDTKDEIEGFYSFFLGLPDNEADLLKLLRISLKDVAADGSDRRGGVVRSGNKSDAVKVTRNNRFLNRVPTTQSPHGAYFWYSMDYINNKNERNVIENQLTDDKDGGEYIWSLPNRLQAYFLTQKVQQNDKVIFKRITEAPINVAVDSYFEDRRVKIRSCARCHINGINTYEDVIFGRIFTATDKALISPAYTGNPKVDLHIERAKQLFSADQMGIIRADQLNYKLALLECTGLQGGEMMDESVRQFATMYQEVLDDYERDVTAEQAAWEFGAIGGIEDYLADKVVSTTKGSLLGLLQGVDIKRDNFENEFKHGKLLQNIKLNISAVAKESSIPNYQMVVPSTVVGNLVEVPLPPGSAWLVFELDKPVAQGGKMTQFGPVTDSKLYEWISNKNIKFHTKIKKVGDTNWVEAGVLFPSLFTNN